MFALPTSGPRRTPSAAQSTRIIIIIIIICALCSGQHVFIYRSQDSAKLLACSLRIEELMQRLRFLPVLAVFWRGVLQIVLHAPSE